MALSLAAAPASAEDTVMPVGSSVEFEASPDFEARLAALYDIAKGRQPADYRSVSADCGIITCTIYFNRSETAFISGSGGALPACSRLGPAAALICAAVITIYGGTAAYAYARGGCLKVKYLVGNNSAYWPDTHYGGRCT